MTIGDLLDEKMRDHNVYGEKGSDIIDIVRDLFESLSDDLKKREPWATNTIHDYETIIHELFTLDLDEKYEGEEYYGED